MPDNMVFQTFANHVLTWIGFGTVIGLIAKAILQGRDDRGSMADILMPIVGALFGAAVLVVLYPGETIAPLSMRGFAVGIAGALVLMVFHRSMGGMWDRRGKRSGPNGIRRRKRGARFRVPVYED